ncbi:MAG: hypothetical protein M0Z75_09305, partial [Nitrospiraceae bacterium]|nr:hypothetical protein [Nitrospiraceae bacterium]
GAGARTRATGAARGPRIIHPERVIDAASGVTKGELAGNLGEITYWYYLQPEGLRCKKTVHFFLMRYISGSTEDHDWEVDAAAWFPIEKALGAVSYKGDREMLEKAKKMIDWQGNV